MNNFKLKTIKDEEGQEAGPNTIELHLTAYSEAGPLGEQLRAAFEIEIMRGTRRPSENGGCYYHFEVDDEKGRLFAAWLMQACFQPSEN